MKGNENLSQAEIAVIEQKDFFIQKRLVTKSVISLMNYLTPCFESAIIGHDSQPRITNGENYFGFPYVVMDYPSFFSKEKIKTFRTLCWYGNAWYFSFLFLDVQSISKIAIKVKKEIEVFKNNNIEVGVEDLWDYRDAILLGELSSEKLFDKMISNGFVRFQKRMNLKVIKDKQSLSKEARLFIDLFNKII